MRAMPFERPKFQRFSGAGSPRTPYTCGPTNKLTLISLHAHTLENEMFSKEDTYDSEFFINAVNVKMMRKKFLYEFCHDRTGGLGGGKAWSCRL